MAGTPFGAIFIGISLIISKVIIFFYLWPTHLFLLWISSSYPLFILLFGDLFYWFLRIRHIFWVLILAPHICCKYLPLIFARLLTSFMGLLFIWNLVFYVMWRRLSYLFSIQKASCPSTSYWPIHLYSWRIVILPLLWLTPDMIWPLPAFPAWTPPTAQAC